jgi:hypothetical protein
MNNFFLSLPVYSDGPEAYQLDVQDVASPIGERLIFFHDNLMFVIVLILVIIG